MTQRTVASLTGHAEFDVPIFRDVLRRRTVTNLARKVFVVAAGLGVNDVVVTLGTHLLPGVLYLNRRCIRQGRSAIVAVLAEIIGHHQHSEYHECPYDQDRQKRQPAQLLWDASPE